MKQIMDLFLTFGRIGALTFGGGYAMISLLDYECVEKKKWLTADELMDVTVIAESTPGPIAINCATYTGYKLAGMGGAVSATIGMILPSFLLIFAISAFFENMLVVGIIEKAFRGIRIAVSILIIQAAARMIRKMMKKSPNKKLQMLIVVSFFLASFIMNIAGVHISTIYFIIGSGFIGLSLFGRSGSKKAGREEL
jgi:chromate transporter